MEGDFLNDTLNGLSVHFDRFMWVQAGQPLLLLQFVISEVSVINI
jgi:hypothetical protein